MAGFEAEAQIESLWRLAETVNTEAVRAAQVVLPSLLSDNPGVDGALAALVGSWELQVRALSEVSQSLAVAIGVVAENFTRADQSAR